MKEKTCNFYFRDHTYHAKPNWQFPVLSVFQSKFTESCCRPYRLIFSHFQFPNLNKWQQRRPSAYLPSFSYAGLIFKNDGTVLIQRPHVTAALNQHKTYTAFSNSHLCQLVSCTYTCTYVLESSLDTLLVGVKAQLERTVASSQKGVHIG